VPRYAQDAHLGTELSTPSGVLASLSFRGIRFEVDTFEVFSELFEDLLGTGSSECGWRGCEAGIGLGPVRDIGLATPCGALALRPCCAGSHDHPPC